MRRKRMRRRGMRRRRNEEDLERPVRGRGARGR